MVARLRHLRAAIEKIHLHAVATQGEGAVDCFARKRALDKVERIAREAVTFDVLAEAEEAKRLAREAAARNGLRDLKSEDVCGPFDPSKQADPEGP